MNKFIFSTRYLTGAALISSVWVGFLDNSSEKPKSFAAQSVAVQTKLQHSADKVDSSDQPSAPVRLSSIKGDPNELMLECTIRNLYPNKKLAVGVVFAPHSFASIIATYNAKPLPRKPVSPAHGSVANTKILTQGMSYSSIVRLNELFDLSKPGIYRFTAKVGVDLLDDADFDEGSFWFHSNELVLTVP